MECILKMIVMGFYDDGLICRECGKAFDSKLALKNHRSLHNKQSCSICGNEISKKNFKRHQERCQKKFDGRSEVVAEQVEVAAAVPVVASPSIPSSLHTEVVRVETGDQDRVEMETEELGVGVEVTGAAEDGTPGLSSLAMEQESEEMGAQQDSPDSLPRMMEVVQEEVAVVADEATPSSPAMVEETQHQVEDKDPGPAQQQPEEQQMTSEDDTMTADSQTGDQEASQQRVGVTLGLMRRWASGSFTMLWRRRRLKSLRWVLRP